MGTSNKGVEKEQQLTDLARKIRASREGCLEGFRTGLEHARTAGTLLTEARALVQDGPWEKWVDANCDFTLRMAQNYMQIAERYDAAAEQMAEDGLVTMTGAPAAIRKLKGASGKRGGEEPPPSPKSPLPAGGFEQKRRALDRSLAEARSAIEHDEKLSDFIVGRLEALLSSVARIVARRLPHLECKGLDAGDLAIVVIEQLKERLDAASLFAAPEPAAAGPAIARPFEEVFVPDAAPAPDRVVDAPDLAPASDPASQPSHERHSSNGKREPAAVGS